MDPRPRETIQGGWATDHSSTKPKASDASLLERFVDDEDRAALTILLERYQPMVSAVCRRVLHRWHDVENACQRTILALMRKAASFRKDASFARWLRAIALRTAWSIRRSNRRRQYHECSCAARASAEPGRPADEAAYHELRERVDAEVRRLPEPFRLAFVRCCLDGESKAAVAVEFGWAEGTVASRSQRAAG